MLFYGGFFMFYVYSKCIKSGRNDFLKVFDDVTDAIRHIAKCYRIDTQNNALGEYYYFMQKR